MKYSVLTTELGKYGSLRQQGLNTSVENECSFQFNSHFLNHVLEMFAHLQIKDKDDNEFGLTITPNLMNVIADCIEKAKNYKENS